MIRLHTQKTPVKSCFGGTKEVRQTYIYTYVYIYIYDTRVRAISESGVREPETRKD